jgi:hypothetical protein
LIKAPLESVRPDAVSRPNREQPESDRAADALGAGVRRAKRWFQTSVRVTKYAAVLHAGAGFLVLLLWWAYGNDPRATGLVWRLADALSPRVGMLESMRACRYPSSWSIALTTVVFATGHVLLLAWLIRGSLGTWWSYLQDRAKSPVFGLRTVDWLFWFPAAIALGCAAYWVTYIDIDTGAHIVCSPSPFNVWMYRMVSTSVTPFFVLLVTAPVDMIFISVHRLFTRRSTGS